MSIVRTRIFTGFDAPTIRFKRFSGYGLIRDVDGTFIHGAIYSENTNRLLTPSNRVTTINKEEVISKFELKGTQSTWIKHIHLSGSLSWEKLDWETAKVLVEAFQFEWTGDQDFDETADAMYLKIFANDPYELPVRITSDMGFPFLANKLVGHSCTINWETTKPLDSRGLELIGFWLANTSEEYLYWS